MKKYEILWIAGILIAFVGAAGADSESLIPVWIILIGCAVIAAGFVVKKVTALT